MPGNPSLLSTRKLLWPNQPKEAYYEYLDMTEQKNAWEELVKKNKQININVATTSKPLSALIDVNLDNIKAIYFSNIKNFQVQFEFVEGMNSQMIISTLDPEASRSISAFCRQIYPAWSEGDLSINPLCCYEYKLTGDSKKDWQQKVSLSLKIGRNKPIKIIIDNCVGTQIISGLEEEKIKDIFVGSCKDELIDIDQNEPSKSGYHHFFPPTMEQVSLLSTLDEEDVNCCTIL